jgi:hypothetical protein
VPPGTSIAGDCGPSWAWDIGLYISTKILISPPSSTRTPCRLASHRDLFPDSVLSSTLGDPNLPHVTTRRQPDGASETRLRRSESILQYTASILSFVPLSPTRNSRREYRRRGTETYVVAP